MIVFVFLSLLYTIVLTLNYFIGIFNSPPYLVFLGAVHYPQDYLYYLSQFTQGATSWLHSQNLYTHEFASHTLVGWTNVLTGRLFHLIGVDAIGAYQISLFIFTLILLLLSVRVLYLLFPANNQQWTRVLAFSFFLFAGPFPQMDADGTLSWMPMFGNVTEPLIRFSRVPHQILGTIALIAPILLIDQLQKTTDRRILALLCGGITLSGLLAATINPVQWILVVATWTITIAIQYGKTVFKQKRLVVAVIALTLGGLPMAVYLKGLFAALPFSQLAAWEALQQVYIKPISFILCFGPVVLLGIAGIPLLLTRRTTTHIFLVMYLLMSLAVFASPLPDTLNLTNIRVLSALTIFAASVSAAMVVMTIPVRNIRIRRFIMWVIVITIGALSLPLFALQLHRNANLNVGNAHVYLARPVYEAYEEIIKRTDATDIILATWPYDVSMPAITGRRGFMGHPLLTINQREKNLLAYDFFDARVPDAAMYAFLRTNTITYVLSLTSVTKVAKPFMQPVYKNDIVTLYKVQ